MAISTQISRLTTLRNNIRTKLIGLGILSSASTSATLSECYNVLSSVTGLGASSYTPTTTSQVIASGQYLSGAQTINAIPSAYLIPSGTVTLSESGTFDVGSYASADVTVTGGPSGRFFITESLESQYYISVSTDVSIYHPTKIGFLAYISNIKSINGFEKIDFTYATASAFRGAVIGCSLNFTSCWSFLKKVDGYMNWFSGASILSDITIGGMSTMSQIVNFFCNCGTLSNASVTIFFPSVTAFQYGEGAFMSNTKSNISFSFPDLVRVGPECNKFFYNCWYITGEEFPELMTVNGDNCFYSPIYASYLLFPKLNSINGNNFLFSVRNASYASFPNLETIRGSGFLGGSGSSLASISLPVLSYWYYGGWYSTNDYKCTDLYYPKLTSLTLDFSKIIVCPSAQIVSAPLLETYGSGLFCARGSNLTSIYFPKLQRLLSSAFYSCSLLPSCNLPELTTIQGGGVFSLCYNLSAVSFPKLTTISGAGIFASCSSLREFVAPLYSYTYGTANMFDSCLLLSKVSFLETSKLSGGYMFRSCYNLISLFFLGSSVCQLGNTIASMFQSTPVSTYSTSAGRWASIYVPASLLVSYKAATNWTTISSKIFAYESYFGTIGSLGYIDPTWTPTVEFSITSSDDYYGSGNGGYYYYEPYIEDLGSHCTVVYDDVVYPLATYSSNRTLFGAPLSGTSYKWDYYPFHIDANDGYFITSESTNTHTVKIYEQLP